MLHKIYSWSLSSAEYLDHCSCSKFSDMQMPKLSKPQKQCLFLRQKCVGILHCNFTVLFFFWYSFRWCLIPLFLFCFKGYSVWFLFSIQCFLLLMSPHLFFWWKMIGDSVTQDLSIGLKESTGLQLILLTHCIKSCICNNAS